MITIRNLRKSYGSNHVLHGIDMDVKAGEFVVMLGLSGAGKSTLLRCMNGLNQPDSGTLQVGDINLMQKHSRRELARHVAMVFQHHNLVQRLSVRKNVLTGRLGQVGTLASVLQLFKQSDIWPTHACSVWVWPTRPTSAPRRCLAGRCSAWALHGLLPSSPR